MFTCKFGAENFAPCRSTGRCGSRGMLSMRSRQGATSTPCRRIFRGTSEFHTLGVANSGQSQGPFRGQGKDTLQGPDVKANAKATQKNGTALLQLLRRHCIDRKPSLVHTSPSATEWKHISPSFQLQCRHPGSLGRAVGLQMHKQGLGARGTSSENASRQCTFCPSYRPSRVPGCFFARGSRYGVGVSLPFLFLGPARVSLVSAHATGRFHCNQQSTVMQERDAGNAAGAEITHLAHIACHTDQHNSLGWHRI